MGFETDSKRGVQSHYGPRVVNNSFGGRLPGNGITKLAMWDFAFDQLPAPGTSNMQQVIPAGSTIVSAKFVVDAAWTSAGAATTLSVGLQQADGTEIDNNGLLTDANLDDPVIEDAADVGKIVTGTGDLVGVSIGAADGELKVTQSVDDLTAGQARVLVEYITAS